MGTHKPDPLRLVILSGNSEGLVEDTTTVLHNYLTARMKVDLSVVQWPAVGGEVDLSPIESAEVVLVFADGVDSPAAELERLRTHCAAGRGVVAMRCNGSAFSGWPAFEREVLGGEIGLRGQGQEQAPYPVDFGEPRREHPIVEDMEPFTGFGTPATNLRLGEVAGGAEVGEAVLDVVAESVLPDGRVPTAWTFQGAVASVPAQGCQQSASRAVATTLGHPRDFWEYDFLRLIENAVLWAGGRS